VIVQTAPEGQDPLVIEQLEHAALAGRLGAAWGNDGFDELRPRALMLHAIAHHDEGWDRVDAEIGQDPATGLPYSLVKTPLEKLVQTGARGAQLGESHHPYCGLLVSLHTYGLYHGRLGLSDKLFVDSVPEEHRPAVSEMLSGEAERQARLRGSLEGDRELAPWVSEQGLMHNYRLLQFFDTLSLYFNCTHDAARGTERFPRVPQRLDEEVEIEVSRVEAGRYRLEPFPFSEPEVNVTLSGRRLAPQALGTPMRSALEAAPTETETLTLVAS